MKPTFFLPILLVSAMLFNLRPSCADVLFPEAYQAAKKLPLEQREDEFLRISEIPGREGCKDAAFAAAANAAADMKKFETAGEHAEKIRDESLRNVTRMSIFSKQAQWSELLELSRDFDLVSFPDALISPAAVMRGTAFARMRERDAAKRDFELAMDSIASPTSKLETMFTVSSLYGSILEDSAREFEILAEILKKEDILSHFYRQRVHCRHAILLAEKGEIEEAIRILKTYPVDKAASRRFEVDFTLGDLYRQKGDANKARALYEAAATMENLSPNYEQRARKRIETLAN